MNKQPEPKPTTGSDADWAAKPVPKLARCPDCGGYRRVSPHPHSVRWVVREGRHARIDCAGREVAP
jgi:hypothetical protein